MNERAKFIHALKGLAFICFNGKKCDNKMHDVVISGAGPAGSKCAEVLASAGYKVALIEKDVNWRKPCGGGVSARIMKKYYPQLKKLNPVIKYGAIMFSGDYSKLEYKFKGRGEGSIVMDRLEMDNLMRSVAVEAGAELFDKNISFDFVYRNQKIIGIKTKTPSGMKEYLGKLIVIADGMSSKLAVKSGLRGKWKITDLGMAKCAIMEGRSNLEKDMIYIYFRPYKGYGWIFPIDDNRYNIGCGTFEEANHDHNLNEIYEEFLNAPYIKEYFPEHSYKEIWKASYPLSAIGVLEKSLIGENIMLIGDAAGFVSPISGEGIHPGIVSGQIAAETAVKALKAGVISKKTLKPYKQHPNIKKIIRNFKLKHSLVEFFYMNNGKNLNTMFKLAENDEEFKRQVINMFFFNAAPSEEFLTRVRTSTL